MKQGIEKVSDSQPNDVDENQIMADQLTMEISEITEKGLVTV